MNYKKQNKGGIYDDFSVVKGYKTSGDAYFFLEVEKIYCAISTCQLVEKYRAPATTKTLQCNKHWALGNKLIKESSKATIYFLAQVIPRKRVASP